MASTNQTYDLVVIGSGPAGQSAAIQASKLNKRVAIIEKHRRVGGVCTFTGTIPSKTLREAIIETVGPARLGGGEWHLTRRPEMGELLERVQRLMQRLKLRPVKEGSKRLENRDRMKAII